MEEATQTDGNAEPAGHLATWCPDCEHYYAVTKEHDEGGLSLNAECPDCGYDWIEGARAPQEPSDE